MLISKNEVDRAQQAKPCPEVVGFERLVHVENSKRDEHAERDDLLNNLELPERKVLKAYSVARDLEHIFKKSDAPADEGGNPPGLFRQIFEVRVPRERHEYIRQNQQADKAAGSSERSKAWHEARGGRDCYVDELIPIQCIAEQRMQKAPNRGLLTSPITHD